MIPILAYHEVNTCCERDKGVRSMEPSCSIHPDLFSQQLSFLKNNNFETIISLNTIPFNCGSRNIEINRVVITFDDGHNGNYLFAFPILKQHNFKAIFFVTTNFIGTRNMMRWKQLREMSESGMAIESHCVSHAPLETLSTAIIKRELGLSKDIIENKIGKEVTVVSLPHGSLHPRLLGEAREIGYKFICTSKIDYYNPLCAEGPQLVPRIPVPDGTTIRAFNEIVSGHGKIVGKLRRNQNFKTLIKKLIGINNYRRLYRFIHNIEYHS